MAIGCQQRLDVIVEDRNERLIVERVEPVWTSVDEQERHIGERTRTETPALTQMHTVTQLPALPLVDDEGTGVVPLHCNGAAFTFPSRATTRRLQAHTRQSVRFPLHCAQ